MRIEAGTPSSVCANDESPGIQRSSGLLSADIFSTVVAHAPLVSIDLIVEDANRRILLGRRRNEPAKDYWFVPGGRIRKHETLDAAFLRLTREELGMPLRRHEAGVQGIYEHFYDSDFSGAPERSTHYIVLAYRLRLDHHAMALPPQQHSEYQWIDENRIADLPGVHPYTNAYFIKA
jgi:colanic acid biosynthesis protein WcaH